MSARRLTLAVLGLALLAPAAPLVRAADSPAADRLAAEWPKAADEARQALLDAAVAAPSRASLDGVGKAAKSSLGMRKEAERLRKSLEARRKSLGADTKLDDPRLADDKAEAENLARLAEREVAALARLSGATGRLLDALPEADALAAVRDLLRGAPEAGLDGYRAFVGQGIGASRLVRTVTPLIETAQDARREIAKLDAQRAEPARKLEDVIRKLNDAVDRYLKAARAKGDDSGLVPSGLVGTLPDQRDDLSKVVNRLGAAIDAADARRLTAREALGAMLAGMNAADADHVVDLVESRLLKDENVEDRGFGLLALALAAGPRPLKLLASAAGGRDPRDAAAALQAMADRPEPEVVGLLAGHLADEAADWRVRASAAAALGRTGRAAAVPPLLDALKSAKGRLVDDLREALVGITGQAYPAVEAPWRAWWDVAGRDFAGPKDPKPSAPGGGGAAGAKPPVAAAPGGADAGFQFYGIESHSTRVLFVLDFSGSMNWAGSDRDEKVTKIDVLRQEMKKSLAALPDGAVFDLIAFSTDVRPWKKEPQVRSAKTAAEALLWVQKMPADGGTNIGDVFEVAFKMMGAGLQKDRTEPPAFDTVFFMTDGRPTVGKLTDTGRLLAAVRRWNEGRKVRIHVVGMGGHEKPAADQGPRAGPGGKAKEKEDDLDEDFLKTLAAENGGQCVIR